MNWKITNALGWTHFLKLALIIAGVLCAFGAGTARAEHEFHLPPICPPVHHPACPETGNGPVGFAVLFLLAMGGVWTRYSRKKAGNS